uniref:cytochrome c heme attachment protein n=1 Tax=Juncus alatus TaxID=1274368 RepID=UPI001F141CE3|nr:cytochrome c heme attachment protein [Juncus alatus]ULQ66587.1 cytochrome c heme attachment protein [Juncus alatus]
MVKLVDTLLLGSSANCISVQVRVAAFSKSDTIDSKIEIYLIILNLRFYNKNYFIMFTTLEHILIHTSFSITSIVISIYMTTLLICQIFELHNSPEKGMIATFFSTSGFLISRWISLKHFPLSNLYESLIFLSCTFCIIHIIPRIQNYQHELSTITVPSTITIPSTILTQGFATSGLSTEMHQPAILVPALQSQWLMMHVSMMLLSYATLLCGSLLSIVLLVIILKKKINPFFISKINYWNKTINIFKNIPFFLLQNYYKYDLIERLDYFSYRFISIGFTFLSIGILCGAVWANEAWGSYWNWDPKETWAFITWTIFAIYLHIRTNLNWKGKNSALVASVGFILIWICYFGINLLGIGLHSYGSFIKIEI